jgi:aspartyl/asparaginyl-tRNA synthetase
VKKTTPTTNLNTPCELQLRERKKNSCEDSFDAIMMEAVDEVFSSIGHSCKQAIYFQLENIFTIKRQEIPLKIEDFANAIEQLFGIGAKFVEMKIIEVLHKKTQGFMYFPKKEELLFTEYVASLRRFYDRKLDSPEIVSNFCMNSDFWRLC